MKRTHEKAFRDDEDDPKEDQRDEPTWLRRLKAIKASENDVAGPQPSEAKETEDGTAGAAQQSSANDDARDGQQVADEDEEENDGLPRRSRISLRKARRKNVEAAKLKRKEKQKLRKRKQRAKKRSVRAEAKDRATAEGTIISITLSLRLPRNDRTYVPPSAKQKAKSRQVVSDWEEQPSYLTQLPAELLFLVIVFMKPKHALSLSHVCRELGSKVSGTYTPTH